MRQVKYEAMHALKRRYTSVKSKIIVWDGVYRVTKRMGKIKVKFILNCHANVKEKHCIL